MRASRLGVLVAMVAALGPMGSVRGEPEPAGTQPEPLRTIEAVGVASIIGEDVAGARQAALHLALRDAVQRTAGVYVSGSVRVRNHAVLEDRVYTRAAGLAVLQEVVEDRREGSTYRIRARVGVRLRPLLRELTATSAPRRWRIAVILSSTTYYGAVPTVAKDAQTLLARQLAELGIEASCASGRAQPVGAEEARRLSGAEPAQVAAWGREQGYDLVITGSVSARVAPGMMVPKEWVGVDYARCWVQAPVRAVRCDTGEVVAADSARGESDGVPTQNAVRAAVTYAMRRAGRSLSEPLLRLPGMASRDISLTVSGFASVTSATGFAEAISAVPGIRGVARQAYAGGTLTLLLSVAEELADSVAAHLESCAALQTFGLRVEGASSGRIAATIAFEGSFE